MSLEAGTKLGVYEIRAPLGAGGMGEVYRAADTKLGREVAIKVLPEELARDRERLDRFEREAKLLGSLNHTNVATLYGLETADDQPFLVMELVEGETLAELIERGPLPPDEATSLFPQIAEGLRAAHEKGVIHRDLKPANVKITPDGVVKILDFGLAKAFVGEDEPPLDTSQSPTLSRGTALGVIMGTAHYMSPEQARGKPVDKRTDIWAFGCCLFEALSGRRAFDGDDAAEVLGAVIHKEPDWDALPVGWPRRLVERCLRKNPRDRLQDIGDAHLMLVEQEVAPTPKRSSKSLALALASVVGLAVGAGLVLLVGDEDDVLPEPKRFSIPLDDGERIGNYGIFDNPLAFSPDGSYLVYAASRGSTSSLYLRDMRSGETKEVPGTTGAIGPSFSPDGQWIGFFAHSRLKKIRLQGGEPDVIAETGANFPGGASWGPDGSIAFSIIREGLFMVSAAAGEREALTTEPLDRFPTFLPDGKNLLVTTGVEPQEWRLGIVDVVSRERTVLDELGRASSGVYLDSGHLLFARGSDLLVARFDHVEKRIRGEPRLVETGVFATFGSYFTVSQSGDLAFVLGDPAQRSLVIVDREGHERHLARGL